MTTYTAPYSPDDNKLRLYASSRLDKELYERVKAAGFSWAPKQELFVAPMWTPRREDLLIELAGEVGDEDTSFAEHPEERAGRFDEYSDSRRDDAESARKAVAAIADNIPFGQPILVGHHSEKHARKDAERIENGMRKAVRMWDTARYWQDRAAGALAHAKYKERPDVRARRIKKLEADLRKVQRTKAEAESNTRTWTQLHDDEQTTVRRKDGSAGTFYDRAMQRANVMPGYVSMCFPADKYPRTRPEQSTYEGETNLWSALGGSDGEVAAICTPADAQRLVLNGARRTIAWCDRWIGHYENRLAYERAMLGDAGGLEADRNAPMKGGACRCWASPRRGWSYIQKVNKVSVTVWDNWGNGGPNFTRTIPFDKLKGVMSPLEVENARQDGRLIEVNDGLGFILHETAPPAKVDTVCPDGPACPDPECIEERERQDLPSIEAMRESLRTGVQVVTAPQLFPTPREVAERVAELADVRPGHKVLEPSAGTGMLLGALGGRMFNEPQIGGVTDGAVLAVELNRDLAERLKREFPLTHVLNADFLECGSHNLGGAFDRIIMNPPFENGADIKHIKHALTMLAPGGKLVAICANGPRQQEKLQPLADSWEELPPGTFAGTGVRSALLTVRG